MNSFGVAIQPTGPGNGFPGSLGRMGTPQIMSKPVSSSASSAGLPFGAGIVETSNSTGGLFLSVADFLATAANVATLQQTFAGIAVRNVQTNYQYASLYASSGTTQPSTTMTQATAGSTTVVVVSAAGIVVGMTAEGYGLASGTTVTGISSTTITISLPTTAVIAALTTVVFTAVLPQGVTGYFQANQQADCLFIGNILVAIASGTPQANLPVYIRVLANANLPGTAIGDFEAADDVATALLTTSTTLGSTTLTTSASTGVAIGQRVTAVGIPANTYIVSGSGTSWVMNNAAVATTSTVASSLSNMALLGTAAEPWLRFRTGNLDNNDVAEITVLVRHAA